MPWVRIDDQYPEHPKITEAGHLAGWLDVCAMAYCNRLLTDGFVAKAMVPRLSSVPAPQKRAAELVAVGRWDVVDGGYQIRDYLDYQKSRDVILRERDLAAKRQSKFRNGRRAAPTPNAGSNGVTDGAVTPSPLPHPPHTVDDNSTAVLDAERDAQVDTPADPAAVAAALAASRRGLHAVKDEPRNEGAAS